MKVAINGSFSDVKEYLYKQTIIRKDEETHFHIPDVILIACLFTTWLMTTLTLVQEPSVHIAIKIVMILLNLMLTFLMVIHFLLYMLQKKEAKRCKSITVDEYLALLEDQNHVADNADIEFLKKMAYLLTFRELENCSFVAKMEVVNLPKDNAKKVLLLKARKDDQEIFYSIPFADIKEIPKDSGEEKLVWNDGQIEYHSVCKSE